MLRNSDSKALILNFLGLETRRAKAPGSAAHCSTAGASGQLGETLVRPVRTSFCDCRKIRAGRRATLPGAEKDDAAFKEIAHNPLLWALAFVPILFVFHWLKPESHTLLFVLSVLAIIPLAALLSVATESVAFRTGDAVGGLLNATLGNLTDLVIALAALHAGQYMLVKASVAGTIVANTLFVPGPGG